MECPLKVQALRGDATKHWFSSALGATFTNIVLTLDLLMELEYWWLQDWHLSVPIQLVKKSFFGDDVTLDSDGPLLGDSRVAT